MAETSAGPEKKPAALKPKDAATLIIVDGQSGEPRVLMGKRRETQVFMPGKYVFPGGRVDKEDKLAAPADDLRPGEIAKLLMEMKGTPSAHRARALGLAAIRETFEEAGLVIGKAGPIPDALSSIPGWKDFAATGHLPNLAPLTFFARAVTPPGRPRRYDTRFFCVEAQYISHRVDIRDGELSSLDWFTFDQMRTLDLPSITRVVLEDLADRLKVGWSPAEDVPVPFYNNRNGTFRRILLMPGESANTT
jgi:8-oxo-dGTP pyrophosphatase MutT (NUDIX family)